jgi:hypothetical protein
MLHFDHFLSPKTDLNPTMFNKNGAKFKVNSTSFLTKPFIFSNHFFEIVKGLFLHAEGYFFNFPSAHKTGRRLQNLRPVENTDSNCHVYYGGGMVNEGSVS